MLTTAAATTGAPKVATVRSSALRTSHSSGISEAIEAEIQLGTLTRYSPDATARPEAPGAREDSIYLTYLHRAELAVATGILRLLAHTESDQRAPEIDSWLQGYCVAQRFELTPEQARAVQLAATSQVLILT